MKNCTNSTMFHGDHGPIFVRFITYAATFGWERVGEVISQKLSETVAAGGGGEGVSEKSESCLATTTTPTKWVLAGHSMGTQAIEMVSKISYFPTFFLKACVCVCV